jgi:hypothetical protein
VTILVREFKISFLEAEINCFGSCLPPRAECRNARIQSDGNVASLRQRREPGPPRSPLFLGESRIPVHEY